MRTVLVLSLAIVTAAQYNYFAQSRLGANVVGNDESVEASLEDKSGPAAYRTYDKEFFSFAAPEGEFEEDRAVQKMANTLKHNLRVIFIKGPENSGLENAALQLAQNSAIERTAIYVLNKQTDVGSLSNKLSAIYGQHSSKPEVHFVKYRSPTDAANAQHAIQSQYESLPGTSSSVNSAPASVLDFASQATVQLSSEVNSGTSSSFIPPNTSYLPANRRIETTCC